MKLHVRFFFKVGQVLLQSGEVLMCYKLEQLLLQNGAGFLL